MVYLIVTFVDAALLKKVKDGPGLLLVFVLYGGSGLAAGILILAGTFYALESLIKEVLEARTWEPPARKWRPTKPTKPWPDISFDSSSGKFREVEFDFRRW